ncbi:MAG: type II toxin-antitoxin system HicB family antitoxin [Oscillospiraceae bacterium]
MRSVYPVVFTKCNGGYMAYVPDFDINSQGDDLAEAIEMARDAIGIMGIDIQDDKKVLPDSTPLESVPHEVGEVVSLVDIDFTAYRRANERRTVRRNVSLPSWLNTEAEKAGINVSALLQTAIKNELKLVD